MRRWSVSKIAFELDNWNCDCRLNYLIGRQIWAFGNFYPIDNIQIASYSTEIIFNVGYTLDRQTSPRGVTMSSTLEIENKSLKEFHNFISKGEIVELLVFTHKQIGSTIFFIWDLFDKFKEKFYDGTSYSGSHSSFWNRFSVVKTIYLHEKYGLQPTIDFESFDVAYMVVMTMNSR